MLGSLPAFVALAAVVICTPGPDTALTVRNALIGGAGAGLRTAAGVGLGQLVWAVASGLGVAGLLLASEPVFRTVQLAGAGYLLFLGVQSLRAAVRGHPPEPAPSAPRDGRALRQGLVSNLANPKMAAFFLSLLPQFVPTGNPVGLLVLGALFSVMTFGWLAGYALLVDRARRVFLRDRVRRTVDAVSGAVLVGFGLRLAAERG